jgi:hypothetical protein
MCGNGTGAAAVVAIQFPPGQQTSPRDRVNHRSAAPERRTSSVREIRTSLALTSRERRPYWPHAASSIGFGGNGRGTEWTALLKSYAACWKVLGVTTSADMGRGTGARQKTPQVKLRTDWQTTFCLRLTPPLDSLGIVRGVVPGRSVPAPSVAPLTQPFRRSILT